MDIVTLECPNCGGKVVREKNEYFAICLGCAVLGAFAAYIVLRFFGRA